MRRREIDRDLELARPFDGFGAGLAQHPFAERHDEADFLGERNEFHRPDHAAFGMPPPQQRFETADFIAVQVDERLVVQLELAVGETLSEIELEDAARLDLAIHLGLEEMRGAATFGLGAIESHVGVAQQRVGAVAVAGGKRDADAGADHDLVAAHLVGPADGLDQLRGERARLVGIAERRLHDGEFVAAQTRHQIAVAQAAAQAVGDRLQQLVADRVAERIVDALEVVEIEAMHRELVALAAHAAEQLSSRSWNSSRFGSRVSAS